MSYKILIVEDHKLIADTWAVILGQKDNITVVGIAASEDEAVDVARDKKPDIVFMDIGLKTGNGIQATQRILEENNAVRIIGLSVYNDISVVHQMILNGAKGFITKNSPTSELLKAIEVVDKGELYFCNEIKTPYLSSELYQRLNIDNVS